MEHLDRKSAPQRCEWAVDERVVPAGDLDLGCARWITFRIGLYSDAGSLIGASAEKRTVIRSKAGSRYRDRDEDAQERETVP